MLKDVLSCHSSKENEIPEAARFKISNKSGEEGKICLIFTIRTKDCDDKEPNFKMSSEKSKIAISRKYNLFTKEVSVLTYVINKSLSTYCFLLFFLHFFSLFQIISKHTKIINYYQCSCKEVENEERILDIVPAYILKKEKESDIAYELKLFVVDRIEPNYEWREKVSFLIQDKTRQVKTQDKSRHKTSQETRQDIRQDKTSQDKA